MAKHAGGRPTKYLKKYCDEVIAFFSKDPFETIEVKTTDKRSGRVYLSDELRAVPLPTMERFAANIGVDTDTLVEWGKVHPEFSVAATRAKERQKDILITNGLMGLYNAGFAQFVSRNLTDLRDKQELDITSGGDKVQVAPVVVSDIAARETSDAASESDS